MTTVAVAMTPVVTRRSNDAERMVAAMSRTEPAAFLWGDAMFAKRLAAGLAMIFFLIGFSPAGWAEEPLNVENWPGDIPCNVLKKHPDGTYEITVAWDRFSQRHAPGTKYRNTRETAFWDQKCKAQTL